MTQILIADTVARLLGIGQLLLIALVVGRGRAPRAMRVTIILLLVSVAAYLAHASSFLQGRLGPFWVPMLFAAQFPPLLLWLFAHLLFERPVVRALAWAASVLVGICGSVFAFAWLIGSHAPVWATIVQHVLSLALLIHAVTFSIRERGDDLVEKRRRFRMGFVLIVGVQALAVVVVELLHGFGPVSPPLILAQSITTLIATFGFGAVLLTSDADLLFDPDRRLPRPELSPSEHVLNQKLEAAMAEAVYQEPGLSIGILAARLGVPEHRLRSLINQRLGYRNFSDFLNQRRVAEAQRLLSDPAKVDLPVLTIAMDLGYGSLAPFNRAFREATGQTPSDYRRSSILQQ